MLNPSATRWAQVVVTPRDCQGSPAPQSGQSKQKHDDWSQKLGLRS